MKLFKKSILKTLCIFLSVVILFFTVNNSYFSPHKMDSVHAEVITITAISVSAIIELIVAIVVAGLACAVINEWQDMDFEDVVNDLHSWCRENYDLIAEYIDGSSALKEWVNADEWVVVDGGGGSNPEPSPDPNKKGVQLPDVWALLNMATSGAILASQYTNGEIPEDAFTGNDFVCIDASMMGIARAYMGSKINNFRSTSASDPFSKALLKRYGASDVYYTGEYPINSSGSYLVQGKYVETGTWSTSFNQTYVATYTLSGDFSSDCKIAGYLRNDGVIMSYWSQNGKTGFTNIYGSGVRIIYDSDGKEVGRSSLNLNNNSYWRCGNSLSVNFPIFSSAAAMDNYFKTGDDSSCLNGKRNYIDTDGDYGWSSTANISPDDLFRANQDIFSSLAGKYVSLASVVRAINALKASLEDNNPNIVGGVPVPEPVPYPTVSGVVPIISGIIAGLPRDNPEPEPEPEPQPEPTPKPTKEPVIDPDPPPEPEPEPEPEPDPLPTVPPEDIEEPDEPPEIDVIKDYSGLLGFIVRLLQDIYKLLYNFFSWFIIDFEAIKAHLLLALSNISIYDGFNDFIALIDDFRSDIGGSYEYPKISIQTPDILKSFYPQAEILLVDFADWANYFIMIRSLLSYTIGFGFIMWVVRNVRISFTLN